MVKGKNKDRCFTYIESISKKKKSKPIMKVYTKKIILKIKRKYAKKKGI